MPTIHVEMFAGRTLEQKRALARALTDATVQTLGGSADHIDIIFTDVQRHDWATGGKLWADAAPAAAPASKSKPKLQPKPKPGPKPRQGAPA